AGKTPAPDPGIPPRAPSSARPPPVDFPRVHKTAAEEAPRAACNTSRAEKRDSPIAASAHAIAANLRARAMRQAASVSGTPGFSDARAAGGPSSRTLQTALA